MRTTVRTFWITLSDECHILSGNCAKVTLKVFARCLTVSSAAGDDAALKDEILDWIQAIFGDDKAMPPVPRDQPFEKVLKDGVVICNLMNKIVPGSVKRINKKGGNFALMENIAAFQKAVKAYGVPEEEVFQTADLFEARNVKAVVKSLYSLGRTCLNKGYSGPTLGPKMAEKQEREWSEDQLREGRQGIIGLQAGSNKGATQAGINMGKGRSIMD